MVIRNVSGILLTLAKGAIIILVRSTSPTSMAPKGRAKVKAVASDLLHGALQHYCDGGVELGSQAFDFQEYSLKRRDATISGIGLSHKACLLEYLIPYGDHSGL